ncbi:hypothetical protein ABG768_012806 [Culter alburnus]|uniref:Uncharacterized protein n=1 Tax=Culter alburnus TaxID=194366 RepID=A0AAW2B3L1_CULAL
MAHCMGKLCPFEEQGKFINVKKVPESLQLFPYRMNAPVTSATTEDTCLLGHPDWLKFQRVQSSMNNKQKSHPMENRLGIPFPITLAYCGLRIRDRGRDMAF